ncbi:glycoside hydrolase family 66 protein [Nakamurella aerolata]|uniref:Dextranase n=1 Tax=Nakamurella aerolata TaxID=1656892 RepID=A0A849A5W7_9ACTN|nr:glycoside hydrolase family 66 protein [Nakamurella aerolata]NNG34783.1 hypothetical protein [Nakamurella aerolata]
MTIPASPADPVLLPTMARFGPDEPVLIEVRGVRVDAELVTHALGETVGRQPVQPLTDIGVLPVGGYGIELVDASGVVLARTAVEVAPAGAPVQRYGFVASFPPGRRWDPVIDNVRRLHLTDIQCYDWAFRHADLVGGGEVYDDPLGQPISLDAVRDLIGRLAAAGSRAIGYAAVYAVGNQEWDDWRHAALLAADGNPYGLGDFLRIVDPAHEQWLAHLRADLSVAAELGFHGFHLDQYGYPKHAVRADGIAVDVAESFSTMIAVVRAELPDHRLIFNQVNDFPTWRTGAVEQDIVYVEPWAPSTTLQHLADIATSAAATAPGKPVVLAAYQHLYDDVDARIGDIATALTMATLGAHGATQLLAGEADRVLVDPYYVRNHIAEPSTTDLLARWYDFLVEHGELLFPAGPDVTRSMAGRYNDDLDVEYHDTPVSEHAAAGGVWRIIRRVGHRYVVHLINLTGQPDTDWDAARATPSDPGPGTLRVRRFGPGPLRVRAADPDRAPRLVDVAVTDDGGWSCAELPAPRIWQLVVVEPA